MPSLEMQRDRRAAKSDGIDRLFEEINLLNLERFLFTTDRKRPPSPGARLEYADSNSRSYRLTVGEFGQPGELAYRVLQAVLFAAVQKGKVCENGVCTFSDRVAMSKRQLARLCGRSWSGAANDADYHRAIMALFDTRLEMDWYNKETDQTKFEKFRIFDNADFIVNDDARHNPSTIKSFESVDITINRVVLNGYDAGYVRAFNLGRLLPLRCVGQMLYKRLFIAFGQVHQKGVRHPIFEKDCDAIAVDWFNQKPRKYLSEIERYLGSHLADLQASGTLKNYEFRPMKTKRGKKYKLVCSPGPAFYEDYSLFLETSAAALPSREARRGEDTTAELLSYFHGKFNRKLTEFRHKELQQAELVLRSYSLEQAQDLVDFALERMAKNTVPQVFGFVVSGYLSEWERVQSERMFVRSQKAKASSCALCDAAGFFHFLQPHAGAMTEVIVRCSHDVDAITRWASEKGYKVPALPEAAG